MEMNINGGKQTNVPKKRGRKPKIISTEIDTDANVEKTETTNTTNIATQRSPEVKRRGRKPSCQIINNIKSYDNNKENIEECLFIHLPLNKSDIEKISKTNAIKNDTNLPVDKKITIDTAEKKLNLNFEDEIIMQMKKPDKVNNICNNTNNNTHSNTCNNTCNNTCINCEKLKTLINELEMKLNMNKLIMNDKILHELNIKIEDIYENKDILETVNTDVCCWWCSHKFDTLPIGLPEKYYDKTFHVIGYFCSFNCAMAHNLSLNDHKIWDRNSLLYHMRNKIYNSIYPNYDIKKLDDIISAPPKSMLKMFGGKLSIEEFRDKSCTLKKQYRLLIPPTISLTQTIEETTYTQEQNLLIKPVKKNLANLTSGLVLKRKNAPLNKSSLFNMMSIQQINTTPNIPTTSNV